MPTVSFEIPDEVVQASGRTADDFSRELRLAAAIKWYESGQLSQGRAAMVAGVSRREFLEALSRFHVSIWQYSPAEVEAELSRVE